MDERKVEISTGATGGGVNNRGDCGSDWPLIVDSPHQKVLEDFRPNH